MAKGTKPAQPASPDRTIEVNGTTYTLRFSIRAMAALQDHYGLPSLDAVGKKLQDTENLSIEDMVAIMWAGLRTHHRDLTMDDALDMLDELGVNGMQQTLGEAMAGAMPDDDGQEADPDRPR
ncbi:MAG TPA: GTA-gp10 family protein [Arenicellales bacterium]|nr:GTA-gp10 family protein [Arenicellales bacterium]